MTELETNLIKILAEATWLRENYRISFEDHQQSLSDIIGWAKECLGKLPPSKRKEMTKEEWEELERKGDQTDRGQELLAMTELEDEHPEDFEGPCFCRLCQSYGD